MNKKFHYDIFHKKTIPQKRFITKNNFTYRHILETVNKFLRRHQTILDIGCGAGTIALYLAKEGHSVLGIDISQKAIHSARQSAHYLKLRNVLFTKMNFPSETPFKKFDFIVCTEVLEHLENDGLALKKIWNLLKPNGIAVISTPSKNAPLYKLGLADDFDKKVGHLRRYTSEELVSKAKRVGFKVIEVKKAEGLLRNFLFLNPIAGKLVRFIKFFLSDLITMIDKIFLNFFGESNIFIVLKKPTKSNYFNK